MGRIVPVLKRRAISSASAGMRLFIVDCRSIRIEIEGSMREDRGQVGGGHRLKKVIVLFTEKSESLSIIIHCHVCKTGWWFLSDEGWEFILIGQLRRTIFMNFVENGIFNQCRI